MWGRHTLSNLFRTHRALTVTGIAAAVSLLAVGAGLALDPRVITGAPAWLKPAKFLVSTSIYALSFVWLLGFVEGRQRLVRLLGNVTALAFCGELLVITVQAVRGVRSHFNVATPFDAALFSIMGVMIVLLWLACLAATVLLLKQRLPDNAFAWSLRLGLAITAAGMAVGFLMTQPTAAQHAALAAGQRVTMVGGHSVGAPDGGPGLPILGWSTMAGDLRVAHFLGLHALQVLPLVGWLLTRFGRRLGKRHRAALVGIAGAAYFGVMAIATWQALRGQSVIAPDTSTLAAVGGLLVAAAAGVAAVLAHARLRAGSATLASAPVPAVSQC